MMTLESTQTKTRAPLIVGMPNIWNRELFDARVQQILDTKVFSNHGPFESRLESEFARIAGVKHCIAVSNATLGLEIALRSLGLQGEVIVPSFTFIATINAIVNCGLRPVFCDVDEKTGHVDLDHARTLVTERTSAILPVNLFGLVCDTDSIDSFASEHHLKMVYDSAHALWCGRGGKLCGGFGEAEVFSLHATKFVNGFEGGLITTNRDDLAASMRRRRNFGVEGAQILDYGTNAKLSEIHAAMALTNLEGAPQIKALNLQKFDEYKRRLPAALELIEPAANIESNYNYIAVLCPSGSRDALIQRLAVKGIITKAYFQPVHTFEFYKSDAILPRTESIAARILSLPTGLNVSVADVGYICDVIASALDS
jgi:dTDP-4-amino-4,6-dideoxygalactose transaminase